MIKKIINKIKEDYREFITARKRIEELVDENQTLHKLNQGLSMTAVKSLSLYMGKAKITNSNNFNKKYEQTCKNNRAS